MRSSTQVRSMLFAVLSMMCFAAITSESVTIRDIKPTQGAVVQLLRQEVSAAAKLNKVPFLQVGASWCPHCRALSASMTDPRMQHAFAGTYIIWSDLDERTDQLAAAGYEGRGVPALYGLNNVGRPTGSKIDGGAWGEDTAANMAPPLKKFFRANGVQSARTQ